MPKYSLVVLTNAVAGREEEFNEWYSGQHLADVVALPGVVSAQRFHLAPLQRAATPSPYRYLAIYEVETDDLAATVAALRERAGTDLMPLSDAMADDRYAYFFEPMGEATRAPA
ncbi:VOC family protein [Acuticoccus sp. I52.16.1]|uniref:VOC family protein n=1 Tax=Acuticoccus sp. I52.16.1 TaxID=2928472 RepID=UPI001FD2DDC7|nr:VOC family protein [Acuticoccus sp. I52.16.1]UOM36565.1 VOC family protein [Acuticoccus sp. I52.16.1]